MIEETRKKMERVQELLVLQPTAILKEIFEQVAKEFNSKALNIGQLYSIHRSEYGGERLNSEPLTAEKKALVEKLLGSGMRVNDVASEAQVTYDQVTYVKRGRKAYEKRREKKDPVNQIAEALRLQEERKEKK